MAPNSFSVLLFVPHAPEILEAIKRSIYTAFYSLIVRSKLLHNNNHNAVENKVYYDLATSLYHFQIGKGNESTGQKS